MATYIFAGASSAMAVRAAKILQEKGDNVIGLSTKEDNGSYTEWYTMEGYASGNFPEIEKPIDGLVYFPGTINLKPFNRIKEEDFKVDYKVNALGAAAFVQAYLGNLNQA